MAKLIYSMMTSADGYTEDADGKFGWGAPEDEAVHAYANALAAPIGTYLYGRRMYDVMVYWETAHTLPDQRPVELEWARQWQATDKVVYSRTLTEPRSTRTRIERAFDADAVRALKARADRDLAIAGPELAAQAFAAGLVDEVQLFLAPVIVGGGTRALPDGVRLGLELREERRFGNGMVFLRHDVVG